MAKASLKNRLSQFWNRWRSSKPKSSESKNTPAHFVSSKRPKGFKVPEWARQDWFSKKDLGQMKPPEELEDSQTQTHELHSKIEGTKKLQAFEDIKKENPKAFAGMNDKDIENFLEDFVDNQKDI